MCFECPYLQGTGKMEEDGSQEIKVWEAGELGGSDPLSPPSPPP